MTDNVVPGGPHTYAVGDVVWVDVKDVTYEGRTQPGHTGWMTVKELRRSQVRDIPFYRGRNSSGRYLSFTDRAITHGKAEDQEERTLQAEAQNIADYLALDGVENEQVQGWIRMLRENGD